MKHIFILLLPLLLSCNDAVKERKTKVEETNETNLTAKKPIQSSPQDTPAKEKSIPSSHRYLKKYTYPNLTAWGGLTMKYDEQEIKIIEAVQNAELGFGKIVYYLEQGEIQTIDYTVHQANWSAYEAKYGDEEIDESKMTYSDRKVTYSSRDIQTKKPDELQRLLNSGKEILEFIETENIDPTNRR